jgi:anti-sigma factor RsiW
MSGQGPENPGNWEEKINALLDGDLDETAAEALKAAAAENSALARKIVDAWRLQEGMNRLALEKAPASLRRKLMRIPREHRSATRGRLPRSPHWALAGGLVSVSVIAVVLMTSEPDTRAVINNPPALSHGTSDARRAEQARRELAITFHYLDKIGLRLGHQIRTELNDELTAPIKDNFSKHMPYTGQSPKEEHA